MLNWYQINVEFDALTPGITRNFHYQLEKENVCISPNVRLAGHAKEARIESLELAQKYLERCLPIFKKRYGAGVRLTIMECNSSGNNKRLAERVIKDSALISSRLDQDILISNKRPTL